MDKQEILDKWDSMTDIEQSSLIAQHVMGWKFKEDSFIGFDSKIIFRNHWIDKNGDPICYFDRFNPIKNIGQAWKVWEIMLDPNRSSIIPIGNGVEGLSYAIQYDNEPICYGKTVMDVICKHAIMSVLGGYNG